MTTVKFNLNMNELKGNNMSNELALVEQYNPLAEIENTNQIIGALMKLDHYKKMGPDVVFAIVAKAKSLRIDPIYALNGGLFSLKGKIGMPAESMAAMIREKGHSIQKDKGCTDTCCILIGKRADNGDIWTSKFSVDDAKKAGIYANTWEKYTSAMCYNRAMSFLARQLFPDVIKGAGYTLDELKEIAQVPMIEESLIQEPTVEIINQEQFAQLDSVLSLCDPVYRKSVINQLSKSGHTIDKMPVDLYERVLSAANKKSITYQESLTKETSTDAIGETETS